MTLLGLCESRPLAIGLFVPIRGRPGLSIGVQTGPPYTMAQG